MGCISIFSVSSATPSQGFRRGELAAAQNLCGSADRTVCRSNGETRAAALTYPVLVCKDRACGEESVIDRLLTSPKRAECGIRHDA